MTFDHWLTIGVIVATLIGPSVAEFVKARLNQPKAHPHLNQPETRIRRIMGWLANILQSPWYLPGFLILANSYFLRQQLLSTGPLTRHVVLSICESVAGILYGGILVSFNNVWKQQREINATHMNIIASTVDDLHTTAQTIHLMQQTQDVRAKITELESREGRSRKKARGVK